VEYAQLLNDGSEISIQLDPWYVSQGLAAKNDLVLNLPNQKPNVAVPVVELFLKQR